MMTRLPRLPKSISLDGSVNVSIVFGIMAAVLLAVGSLLSLRDAGGPPGPMPLASADVQRSEQSRPRYSSKPIRDIQPIADRVLADNPETPGQAPSDFGEFDRESWRIVRLEVPKPDEEWMRVTLARPLTWLETARRDEQGRLWLEFKELGIANWANVLAIEPCPEAAEGDGRLVTGNFEHSSAEVIDLFVDGVSEPIGTTSNHPFWSEDRRDFVQAGQLRIGERLRLRDGSTPVVRAAVPRSQSVPVFNLEVDGEHVYYVSTSGVLVHNSESYITEQEAREAGIPFDANDLGDRASEFGHHQTEDHHPLKESKTFFEDQIRPNVEDVDYDKVKGWTVPLDTDVHQGMEKAGWWQQRLTEEIDRAVDRNGGNPIPFHQLENIGHDLLDEMDPWHPWPIGH